MPLRCCRRTEKFALPRSDGRGCRVQVHRCRTNAAPRAIAGGSGDRCARDLGEQSRARRLQRTRRGLPTLLQRPPADCGGRRGGARWLGWTWAKKTRFYLYIKCVLGAMLARLPHAMLVERCAMSNVKQDVESLLNRLPDTVSVEDIQYHLYVLDKVRRGLEDARVNSTLSQEEVESRFSKWLTE